MGTGVVSVFGLSQVDVKLPTDVSWVNIPSSDSASFKATVSETEQWGDDALQNVWLHSPKGQIVVKTNKVAMAALEKVSGSTARNFSGTAEHLDINPDGHLLPPYVCVRAKMASRDNNGTAGNVWIYLYKCQVKSTFESFPDAANQKVGEVTLTFDSMRSTRDENNGGLATAAFGRIEIPL